MSSFFAEQARQAVIVSSKNRRVPLHGYYIGTTVYYVALESYYTSLQASFVEPAKFTLISPTGERSILPMDTTKIKDNLFVERRFDIVGESAPSVTMRCQFYPYGIKFDLSGLANPGNYGVRNKYKVLIEIGGNRWMSNSIILLTNTFVRTRLTDDPSDSDLIAEPYDIVPDTEELLYQPSPPPPSYSTPIESPSLESRVARMEAFLQKHLGYRA